MKKIKLGKKKNLYIFTEEEMQELAWNTAEAFHLANNSKLFIDNINYGVEPKYKTHHECLTNILNGQAERGKIYANEIRSILGLENL